MRVGGCSWLEIVTGRAHTDEEVVGAAQEEGEVPHVWRRRRVRYEGGGEHPAPVEMSTSFVKGWDFMQC